MRDVAFPWVLPDSPWTVTTKILLLQNGNSPALLFCVGTYSVPYLCFTVAPDTEFKLFYYPELSSSDFPLDAKLVFFLFWFPVHLLSISGHCIPVGSQHLISRRQGPLY